eukprot:TRINITY_DN68580_c0_g1_i1.p1 TRINITY_DN68580_c0_g1~~TRINITY_DN68580_c0_g1_i1.p1  ORF type:complete len:787 (+),score=121.84 TRINITY_DN68580_c0_g1_i1:96-2456(+)
MDKILEGVQELIDRLNNFALATCGGCGTVPSSKGRAKLEPYLSRVFSLRALGDADVEAQQATHRGAALLREGRVEEALRELHEARSRLPTSHEARCNLGCAYLDRGDEDAALHWYRESHRLAPEDEIVTVALAYLESRIGQMTDAQWLLTHFLQEVDSSSVLVLRQLGKLQQSQEQWKQATNTYRRLQVVEPSNPEWPANLQRCLEYASSNGAGPPQNCTEVSSGLGGCALIQRDGGGYGAGGGCVGGGGKYSVASGNSSSGGGGGGNSLSTSGRSIAPPAEQLVEASKLRDSGHPVAALAAYKAILRALPNPASNPEIYLNIADCQFDLGQHEGAIESLRKVLSIRPEDAEANLRMAELMIASGGSASGADAYLKRAIGARSDRNLKHRILCVTAAVALGREDHRQALSSASEAVRIDASSPQALLTLGEVRLHVADYPSALRALSAAIDVTANRIDIESKRCRAQAHTLSAQAYERQRQYSHAIEQAQMALDLNPQLNAAHVVRAMALHQSGRGREALMELEAVLQHSPQNAPALLQLGYSQLCANDPRAVSTLEVAAFGTSASGSTLGAAKIYLALALNMQPERSSCGRPEQVLREGLAEHRNLKCVWQEIDQGLGARDPVASVQKLRGICDLDLSTAQARQLLSLLAAATGRSDLSTSFSGVVRMSSCEPGRSGGGSCPGSRPGSVPPNRWAPTGSSGPTSPGPQTRQISMPPSPGPGAWNVQQGGARGIPHAQQHQGYQQPPPPWRRSSFARQDNITPGGSGAATPFRGRSASPAPFPIGF